MRILLLGEYSSLHWTLAEGLRQLGHSVTVASDGDGFKNYPRNVNLLRESSNIKDTFLAAAKIYKSFQTFKGFDIVQLINPCFTTLNVSLNKYLYRFLKKNNERVFLGAFGDDYFWLKACLDNSTFRYSEFFVNGKENKLEDNERLKKLWLNSDREVLNKEIADTCDGIIACMCEYYMAYKPLYSEKLTYIPFPVNTDNIKKMKVLSSDKLRFFIGINKARSEFKGTDKLYKALLKIEQKYKSEVDINLVESVAYSEYVQLMSDADIVLDQLYSYSPAMNGLLALAMGKVLVGGAEPEMYDLLSETNNKPIVNVFPSEEGIYTKLENIVLNKQDIPSISDNSRRFVEDHHNYINIAKQYLDFWTK